MNLSKAVQVTEKGLGLPIRFYLMPAPGILVFVCIACACLSVLNGLDYYLYWRVLGVQALSCVPVSWSRVRLHTSGAGAADSALHAVLGAAFFQLITGQLVMRVCLRFLEEPATIAVVDRRVCVALLMWAASLLPSCASRLVLVSRGTYDLRAPAAALFVITLVFDMLALSLGCAYAWSSMAANWLERRHRATSRLGKRGAT